jgi:hypothetical protein
LRIVFFLALVICPLIASAQNSYNVTLVWHPVLTDVSGKPLVGLKGYKVYLSRRSFAPCPSPSPIAAPPTVLTVNAPATSKTIKLYEGDYYVAVSAFTNTQESGKSNEVFFSVPTSGPSHPVVVQIQVQGPINVKDEHPSNP